MKTQQHIELWQKIATFKLDDPISEFPFSKKLAQENKWTEDFALRVIAEYKKFVFLCATLPDGASPSPIVDEAWHLHLTYTQNYWNDFCPNVLGFQLHHHPSKGGKNEAQKHNDWYRTTLENYIHIFEEIPPTDIWNYPLNFNPAAYLPDDSPLLLPNIDKNEAEYYPTQIENNQTILSWAGYGLAAIMGVGILFPFLIQGSLFIWFFIILGLTVVMSKVYENRAVKEEANESSLNFSNSLSPYFGAWLSGGESRVTLTALYEALPDCSFNKTEKSIKFQTPNKNLKRGNPLQKIIEMLEKPEISVELVKNSMKTTSLFIEKELNNKGYLSQLTSSKSVPLLIIFIVIGAARIIEGASFHKPIGFLTATMAITGIAYIVLSQVNSLKVWRDVFHERFTPSVQDSGNDLSWQLALVGITINMTNDWRSIDTAFQPPKQHGDGGASSGCSGSSCGGDGGGGGCGGGCGGCGGCGS